MRRFDMYVPEDLTDLLEYLDSHQSGVHIIANGSDLINRIQRRQVNPRVLVDLSGLSEFNYVRKEGNTIRIGAMTTISDLIASPIIDSRHDVFREAAAKFGGPSIRNVATVGGNICAASSSEDLLPVLLVLDEPSACAFEKIGMRNSLIIAFVSATVYLKLDKKSERAEQIRITFNRVGGKIPERVKHTEEKLRAKILNPSLIGDAIASLRSELRLSSDFRVSGEDRSDVAWVLFKGALNRCVEKLVGE